MLIVTVHSVNCVTHVEEYPLNEQVVYGQQGHSPTGRKPLRRWKLMQAVMVTSKQIKQL